MSSVTIDLPDSLKERIEELAASEGITPSQFISSAAGEKLAAHLSMGYLREEAAKGKQEDFDRYINAIPSGRDGDE